MRLSAAAMVGVIAALALLAVLNMASDGAGFANTPAASNYGWIVPLVSGVLVGAVALVLITSSTSEVEDSVQAQACVCSECSGVIRGEWRLCPHCGARLADDDPKRAAC